MIHITLPDGSVRSYDECLTVMDVAKDISEGFARNVISASFNEQVVETSTVLESDGNLVLYTWKDDNGNNHEASAQRWVKNSQTGKELEYNWIFAGSSFWKNPKTGIEYYQADGGDLVCVSNFPAATLDLPITSSQANNSLLFEVFTGRVPKRGTPVELVFSQVK